MDFSNIKLLSGLGERLQMLSARSSVIAENIANADTPGYRAKTIQENRFESLAQNASQMRKSRPEHIGTATTSFQVTRDKSATTSTDENSVSIETETMKLSQTRMEYGLASTVYRKSLDMIRLAIRSDR